MLKLRADLVLTRLSAHRSSPAIRKRTRKRTPPAPCAPRGDWAQQGPPPLLRAVPRPRIASHHQPDERIRVHADDPAAAVVDCIWLATLRRRRCAVRVRVLALLRGGLGRRGIATEAATAARRTNLCISEPRRCCTYVPERRPDCFDKIKAPVAATDSEGRPFAGVRRSGGPAQSNFEARSAVMFEL